MKQETPKISKLETITDIHRIAGLSGPPHPLITLIEVAELIDMCRVPVSYVLGFYKISFATKLGGKFRYGQGRYDFDEGSLVFAAPNQIVGKFETEVNNEGISLFRLFKVKTKISPAQFRTTFN